MTEQVIKLKVQRISPELFKPYGEVIAPRDDVPRRGGDIEDRAGPHWRYLWKCANLDFDGENPFVGFNRVTHCGFRIDHMERHVRETQVYIPFGGKPWIVVAAPPTDPDDPDSLPDLDALAAFLIDGNKGVCYERGTWHCHPLPLADEMDFAVITRRYDFPDDMDRKDLYESANVTIELIL